MCMSLKTTTTNRVKRPLLVIVILKFTASVKLSQLQQERMATISAIVRATESVVTEQALRE